MTLDLLDLLIVASFFPGVSVPWWGWVLGVFSMLASNYRLQQLWKKVAKL